MRRFFQFLILGYVISVSTVIWSESFLYTGKLAGADGQSVTGTTFVSMVAELYDDPLAGNRGTFQEYSSVRVDEGVFSIEIANTGLNLEPLDLSAFRFLQLTINNEQLSPRRSLNFFPLAVQAGDSQRFGGLTTSDFLFLLESSLPTQDLSGPVNALSTRVGALETSRDQNSDDFNNVFLRLGQLEGKADATDLTTFTLGDRVSSLETDFQGLDGEVQVLSDQVEFLTTATPDLGSLLGQFHSTSGPSFFTSQALEFLGSGLQLSFSRESGEAPTSVKSFLINTDGSLLYYLDASGKIYANEFYGNLGGDGSNIFNLSATQLIDLDSEVLNIVNGNLDSSQISDFSTAVESQLLGSYHSIEGPSFFTSQALEFIGEGIKLSFSREFDEPTTSVKVFMIDTDGSIPFTLDAGGRVYATEVNADLAGDGGGIYNLQSGQISDFATAVNQVVTLTKTDLGLGNVDDTRQIPLTYLEHFLNPGSSVNIPSSSAVADFVSVEISRASTNYEPHNTNILNHITQTSGNPHQVVAGDLGLGNVADIDVTGNFSQVPGAGIDSSRISAVDTAGLDLTNQQGYGIHIQDSTGFVGVNTDAPLVDLHVSGEIYADQIHADNLSSELFTMELTESEVPFHIITGPSQSGTAMAITSSGQVGIGTSMPYYSLDIVGTLNVNGDILQYGSPLSAGGGAAGTGIDSTVFGSTSNSAGGTNAFVGGGQNNNADSLDSAILGGTGNYVGNYGTAAVGGYLNSAYGVNGAVLGGELNVSDSPNSAIVGGSQNIAVATGSAVIGGSGHEVYGDFSSVVGGVYNTAAGPLSVVLGGSDNSVFSGSSGILAGDFNTVNAQRSAAIAGQNNAAMADDSVILGGISNNIYGSGSIILGGSTNSVQSASGVILGGSGISLQADRTLIYSASAGAVTVSSEVTDSALFMVRRFGVNTDNPQARLHVVGGEPDGESAAIAVENENPSGYALVRFKTPGSSYKLSLAGSGAAARPGELYIYDEMAGQVRMRIATNGFLAMGDIYPDQQLTVGGMMRLAPTTATVATTGTLRFDGTDYEAFLGGSWVSLTSGGGSNSGTGEYSFIGAGQSNTAGATNAAVIGGQLNTASGLDSFVAAGYQNIASGTGSFIGAGSDNLTTGLNAFIGGGYYNEAGGADTFVGSGSYNKAMTDTAAVVGGSFNEAQGVGSAILGGNDNQAMGTMSAVLGGSNNTAVAFHTSVGGGALNTAAGDYSTIGGGFQNETNGYAATVAGGEYNQAMEDKNFIGGGKYNYTYAPMAVVVGGESNSAVATGAAVLGGYLNIANADYASVAGGNENTAGGPSAIIGAGYKNEALAYGSAILGGQENKIGSSANYGAVVGGQGNWVYGNHSFIGSGESNQVLTDNAVIVGGSFNVAEGEFSSVVGGQYNTASANGSFTGGGENNVNYGYDAFLGGGSFNTIETTGTQGVLAGGYYNVLGGYASVISGGDSNIVTGDYSAVPGGYYMQLDAPHSFGFNGSMTPAHVTSETSSVAVFMVNHFSVGETIIDTNYIAYFDGDLNVTGQVFENGVPISEASSGVGTDSFLGAGFGNEAFGTYSVVVGGENNIAYTSNSTISGGQYNETTEDGSFGFIGGGVYNEIIGEYGVVSGGYTNSATYYSAVVGGAFNDANGDLSFVGAGSDNLAEGDYSLVAGGNNNWASGHYLSVVGGANNTGYANFSVIAGGASNFTSDFADYAFIGAGESNQVTGAYASVVGGAINSAAADFAFVGGGLYNTVSGDNSLIGAGEYNLVTGPFSAILGGANNEIHSGYSVIPGGADMTLYATNSFAFNGLPTSVTVTEGLTSSAIFMVERFGVNTTDPTTTFEVNGRAKVTELEFPDGSVQTTGFVTDVSFEATMTATDSIATGSFTTLTFNDTTYNVGNGFNTTSGEFTAPVTGLYTFNFQARWESVSANMNMRVRLIVNDTDTVLRKDSYAVMAGVPVHVSFQKTIKLYTDDTVIPDVFQDSGGNRNLTGEPVDTFFEGRLIRLLD